ncbi:PDZ domain-containing protein [Occallatibacter savannae]|uniref:PDZ domain-containing protein n=1 Tax=Occallatibacter savannae TaxID=1002691 RepID=UPI0013A5382B|nr:PDZ domain-containing protein [Occallatibacter savannae]
MRPNIQVGVALLGAAIILAPQLGRGQLTRITQIFEEPNPLLHSAGPAQGYLGVLVGDIDNDSATRLKLKDVRGAVITLIDHDAPAAQVGLRVNDVLLEVNGQPVEGAEAFGRMMREIPPGRKITIVVSRDGATQTLNVQLVDRKKLDTDIWNKLNSGSDISSPVTGLGIFGSGASGDAPLPGGFHMPFVGNSTLKLGALVEPLTAQMADYLGIANGLMVKQVARKSQAAAAGMKPFDVILKVGADNIATVSDWDRAVRANQGKTVVVTILRDKKQQTVNLLVDSKKKSDAQHDSIFGDESCPLIALADPDAARLFPNDQSAFDLDSVVTSQVDDFRNELREFEKQLDNQNQLDDLSKQVEHLQSLTFGDMI